MLESISGDSLYANVIMLRGSGRTFMGVEGPQDVGLLSTHIDTNVHPLVAGGRIAAERLASLAHDDGLHDVVVLADRDLTTRLSDSGEACNLFLTTGYDLVDDLLKADSGLMIRVLTAAAPVNLASAKRGSRPLDEASGLLADELIRARVLNEVHCLGLKFRDLPLHKVVRNSLMPDLRAALVFVLWAEGSAHSPVDPRTALSKEVDMSIYGGRRNGHDLLRSAVAFVNEAGRENVGEGGLLKLLAVGLSCRLLHSLHCIREMDDWAARHGRSIWTCESERTVV